MGASSQDEMVVVLVMGWSRFGGKGLISGPIRQLLVGLGKVIILVKGNHSVALISWKNNDVGVSAEGAEGRFFLFGGIGWWEI